MSAAAAHAPQPVYIGPADANEVLLEQLRWLIEHHTTAHGGAPLVNCEACASYSVVSVFLLRPFRNPREEERALGAQ